MAVAVTSTQWHYANIRLTFILQSRLQMFRNGVCCASKRILEPLNILGTDLDKAIQFSSRSSSDFVTELNCNYYTSQKYIAQISFCFAFLPALIYHTPYLFGVPTWVLTNDLWWWLPIVTVSAYTKGKINSFCYWKPEPQPFVQTSPVTNMKPKTQNAALHFMLATMTWVWTLKIHIKYI